MRKLLTALTLAATAAFTSPAQAEDSKNLVTVVTSGDAQTQLMSMVLTMQSVQQGAEAQILLCGPAGDMALKEAPASVTAPQEPKGMSPQGLMKMIMDKTGTKVEVCALYLPNKGVDASALLDGVGAAKPPAMAAALMTDDTTVMSF
jgi:predicted peroxiredoxin